MSRKALFQVVSQGYTKTFYSDGKYTLVSSSGKLHPSDTYDWAVVDGKVCLLAHGTLTKLEDTVQMAYTAMVAKLITEE